MLKLPPPAPPQVEVDLLSVFATKKGTLMEYYMKSTQELVHGIPIGKKLQEESTNP